MAKKIMKCLDGTWSDNKRRTFSCPECGGSKLEAHLRQDLKTDIFLPIKTFSWRGDQYIHCRDCEDYIFPIIQEVA